MAINLEKTIDKIRGVNWQWTLSWWDNYVLQSGLSLVQDREENATFVDGDEVEWTAYYYEEQLLAVQFDLLTVDLPESISTTNFEMLYADVMESFRKFKVQIDGLLSTTGHLYEYGQEGYPEDQDCPILSLWFCKNSRLMLQLKNEGFEYPIRLIISVESLDVFEDW
jgi:hypothetical protein